jgi:hypothetical protein
MLPFLAAAFDHNPGSSTDHEAQFLVAFGTFHNRLFCNSLPEFKLALTGFALILIGDHCSILPSDQI